MRVQRNTHTKTGDRGNWQRERRLARSQQLITCSSLRADRWRHAHATDDASSPGDLTARVIGRAPQPGRPAGQWRWSFRRAARHRSRRFWNGRITTAAAVVPEPGSVPIRGFEDDTVSAPGDRVGLLNEKSVNFCTLVNIVSFRRRQSYDFPSKYTCCSRFNNRPCTCLFLFIIVYDAAVHTQSI